MTGHQFLRSLPQFALTHPAPALPFSCELLESGLLPPKRLFHLVFPRRTRATRLDDSDTRTTSGLSAVTSVVSGNLSRLPSAVRPGSHPARLVRCCGFSLPIAHFCWFLLPIEKDLCSDGLHYYPQHLVAVSVTLSWLLENVLKISSACINAIKSEN